MNDYILVTYPELYCHQLGPLQADYKRIHSQHIHPVGIDKTVDTLTKHIRNAIDDLTLTVDVTLPVGRHALLARVVALIRE